MPPIPAIFTLFLDPGAVTRPASCPAPLEHVIPIIVEPGTATKTSRVTFSSSTSPQDRRKRRTPGTLSRTNTMCSTTHRIASRAESGIPSSTSQISKLPGCQQPSAYSTLKDESQIFDLKRRSELLSKTTENRIRSRGHPMQRLCSLPGPGRLRGRRLTAQSAWFSRPEGYLQLCRHAGDREAVGVKEWHHSEAFRLTQSSGRRAVHVRAYTVRLETTPTTAAMDTTHVTTAQSAWQSATMCDGTAHDQEDSCGTAVSMVAANGD
ncbi:uncharacterized protein [Dermacentor albipictus]|uniref:uncharacterized protein n=1 Tax=Dermacentor albipictus TaxID=60249 RepID=UPI0038FBFD0F